ERAVETRMAAAGYRPAALRNAPWTVVLSEAAAHASPHSTKTGRERRIHSRPCHDHHRTRLSAPPAPSFAGPRAAVLRARPRHEEISSGSPSPSSPRNGGGFSHKSLSARSCAFCPSAARDILSPAADG